MFGKWGSNLSAQIIGKVAAIIDEFSVVINVGRNQGVKEDMTFKIVAEKGEIKDPDTKEVLGFIEYPKATVAVVHVREKFSIAKSYETRQIRPYIVPIPDLFGPRTVTKELPLAEEDLEILEPIDKNIRVGDKVVQILPETLETEETEE